VLLYLKIGHAPAWLPRAAACVCQHNADHMSDDVTIMKATPRN